MLIYVRALTRLRSPRLRLWAAEPLIFPLRSAWSGAPELGDTNKANGSKSDPTHTSAKAGGLQALTLKPPAVDLHNPAENTADKGVRTLSL